MKNRTGMKNVRHGRLPELRRSFALLLAGCVLAGALAGCGDKDKEKDQSSSSAGTSSFAPIASPSPTPVPTAKAVRVNVDDSLNVRKSGSTEADILGTVEDGDELALLTDTEQDGWYQVSYQGGVGYVSAEFVKVIDVTVEKYNALKESGAASTPEGTATPAAGTTPDPGNSGSKVPGTDSEDGE